MRTIISVLLAAIVTVGLLFLMSLFIKDEEVKVEKEPHRVPIDDVTIPKKKPEPTPEELTPPQPPAIEPTPEQSGEVIETNNTAAETEIIAVFDPDINVALPGELGEMPDMDFTQESEAVPMFRTQPNYPIVAQQRGLEGWVLLKYDVDTSGALSNIDVLDSEPRRIFDKEAVRALKKWKFKPAMTNGHPIASVGQTVKIEFNMDQE
jgi:protein TonB